MFELRAPDFIGMPYQTIGVFELNRQIPKPMIYNRKFWARSPPVHKMAATP